MGFVATEESEKVEMEEMKRMVVACAGGVRRRKDNEEFKGRRNVPKEIDEEKLVCVTSGVSFLGLALVNRLLHRGYSVRIIVDHQENRDELREQMRRTGNNNMSAVTAKLTEVDELVTAFEGCRGVFHTAAFTDPAGLSGYSKSMAAIEVKATENVMKACARAASVRNCVLTSSLLACIWRDVSLQDLSPIINHNSWSDESLCFNKKLWYALGKLKSEKIAWKIAEENGLKLATICPGLITGPDFIKRNPTPSIAYLKGAQEMYADGVLATVDVMRLVEAHVCVYEAMNKASFGRYICFDRVIASQKEAQNLAKEMGILPASKICGTDACDHIPFPFELSNRKLTTLMSTTHGRCYNETLFE